ncbi:MAG: aroB [Dehalococcoidia bacterium]|nr:aroB [Dehalococcoidia bacterium]
MIAQLLGWDFIDTDEEIARRAGKPIADIFAQDGEAHFRQLERHVVAQACAASHTVVSTGGGAIVDTANYRAMASSGFILCLEATPETIAKRLQKPDGEGETQALRPLLTGPEPLERIWELKAQRQPHYARAQGAIPTDDLTPQEVAREALRSWQVRAFLAQEGSSAGERAPAFVVQTPSATYPVYVGWGLLDEIGTYLRRVGIGGPVYIVTDENVLAPYGQQVQRALGGAGIEAHCFTVPSGETSKSLKTAETIFSWLAERRCERGHAIIALGGGVVGDLAGFVAATFLRGLSLVQVPTSLAAMVDASIGGKTAVNLPVGKNLVGAFHQPRMVLADLDTLRTLPSRELTSGWAEAIKHGLILDAPLFQLFGERAEALLNLEPQITAEVVRRSMAIKARVVEEDEKETTGRRTLLNYGHTIGHALEAATQYRKLLHGEAVSVGMTAAAQISHGMGLFPREAVERQAEVLRRFGLPTSCPGVETQEVLKAMELDKKAASGVINWVLLEGIGHAALRSDVPQELVQQAIRDISR